MKYVRIIQIIIPKIFVNINIYIYLFNYINICYNDIELFCCYINSNIFNNKILEKNFYFFFSIELFLFI